MKTTAYTVDVSQVANPDTTVGTAAFTRKGEAQIAAHAAASNGSIARIHRVTVTGKPAEILTKGLSGDLDEMCEFALVETHTPGSKIDSLFPGVGGGYLVGVERHEPEEASSDE